VPTTCTRGSSLVAAVVAAGVLTAAAVLTVGCGGSAGGHAAAAASERASATAPDPPASRATPEPSPSPSVIPVPPPPGNLPQTPAFPSASTRVFRAEMTDLWTAVLTGKPGLAAQVFFPLTAYTQVKAISNPAADWRSRLFGEFALDVGASDRALGAGGVDQPRRVL
jgi:hypothetical protein